MLLTALLATSPAPLFRTCIPMTRHSQWPLFSGSIIAIPPTTFAPDPWVPLPHLHRVPMAYAMSYHSTWHAWLKICIGCAFRLGALPGHSPVHPLPLQVFAQVVFLSKACSENSTPPSSSVLLSQKYDDLGPTRRLSRYRHSLPSVTA